ncbi:Lrp/AsnC family transcriptional regulator [uncultured Roseobacter sp.]|uniref:Lrp/AsnC family transcriptional regulator n=1 Tax=uncultured Roseobacter sp. TaxID=114847 RepID=UPI002631A9F6|nr:Lrp/AsnC family transcriptional regulator [uncultured Roseobacter sp.]
MPDSHSLDETDRKIIRALQENGRMTNLNLAAKINLSPSPCLRRLKLLEQRGVISGYTVNIDAEMYGLPVTVMVRIRLDSHNEEVVGNFESHMNAAPEVLECYVMTGLSDYLLRVVVKDLKDYERFVRQRLHLIGGVASIDTSFVYGVVKRTHVFPEIEN